MDRLNELRLLQPEIPKVCIFSCRMYSHIIGSSTMRSMRRFGSFALVIASFSFSGVAGAGPQDSVPAKRLFGYQDLQTGIFYVLPHPAATAASTVVTGEYEI